MKIAVIGPGAIGCLFGALLSRAGNEVWLVDRHPQRARMLNRRGLLVSGASGPSGTLSDSLGRGVLKGRAGADGFRAAVRATANPQEVGPAQLVMVAVKSFDTAEAAAAAKQLVGSGTTVLTLQNGLGNVEVLQEALGEERVIGGVTSQGATMVAPGHVYHAGDGPTVIGECAGSLSERLLAVQETFSQAGIQTEATTDLASALWGKLVVNVGLNAVGALAHVRNGGIMESASLRQVMGAAVREAVQVALARGIALPQSDMATHAEGICRHTADNMNSMLQDVLRKRRTEVEAINGAVVREGPAAGVPTPVNQALLWLVKGIEETYPIRLER